ncbi:conserved hypothetical protein [Pseudomonas sp. 8Z]|uniref:hypothetical protein n=1 Tax=Pseudomonas sp. 8Z TaxID=2653166 RepID=UPI0012F17CBC|nr:hypothetical protein [Pseudomonas sp. 8Z]VXC23321.1 conserved hypothetical protein [Pseudomonas sp. 8Z]
MKGKYWPDHLAAGSIDVGGSSFSLAHLRQQRFIANIAEADGKTIQLALDVEFSSHCVSKGPRNGTAFDFSVMGYDQLLIDHRNNWRAFHAGRHGLSYLLPGIMGTLHERPCLFTGHENFLTVELHQLLPGYPPGSQYEVYFSARQGSDQNSVRVIVESAYVRDGDADNDPYKFKKDDRIKGWRLLLKKARGEGVRRPPNRGRR